MKEHFDRFVFRFVAVLLIGLLLMTLRGHGALAVFTPQYASAWELGKLLFWPMLAAFSLTAQWSGGWKRTLRAAAPAIVLAPLALQGCCWAVQIFHPAAAILILLWVIAAAIGTALADQGQPHSSFWLLFLLAEGVLFAAFTFCAPMFGPFLDPRDVAAMKVIPW